MVGVRTPINLHLGPTVSFSIQFSFLSKSNRRKKQLCINFYSCSSSVVLINGQCKMSYRFQFSLGVLVI
jgi:hypothetical protein